MLPDAKLLRHLVDSATHGGVGFCAWGVFLCEIEQARGDFRSYLRSRSARRRRLVQSMSTSSDTSSSSTSGGYYQTLLTRCLTAGIAASALDIDHFIAAGSLSIAGATHLKSRPFGHAVTFIAVLVAAVLRFSRHRSSRTRRLRVSFVIVALLSHQLRDGFRRGLWFWPVGSTPPIPYVLYLAMEQGLPLVMARWALRGRGEGRGGGDGEGNEPANKIGVDNEQDSEEGGGGRFGDSGDGGETDETALLTATDDDDSGNERDDRAAERPPWRSYQREFIV